MRENRQNQRVNVLICKSMMYDSFGHIAGDFVEHIHLCGNNE